MSLPTQDELDHVLDNRPADDLYPTVKDHIDKADDLEQVQREKLLTLITKDLVEDLAVANAMDGIGIVIEYLSQKRKITPPSFDGNMLMRAFGRISALKLSLDYAKFLGLKGEDLNIVRKAEVDRLWGDTSSGLIKKLFLSKSNNTNAKPTSTGTGTGVKKDADT